MLKALDRSEILKKLPDGCKATEDIVPETAKAGRIARMQVQILPYDGALFPTVTASAEFCFAAMIDGSKIRIRILRAVHSVCIARTVRRRRPTQRRRRRAAVRSRKKSATPWMTTAAP